MNVSRDTLLHRLVLKYTVTATLLGQACLCLLKDDVVAKKLGGGILTPATLGQPFIDRLGEEGFKIELRMMEQ